MDKIEQEVRNWLKTVVIGLNLCPFARKPESENRIRCVISEAQSDEVLLAELQDELEFLDATPASKVETTLVILPTQLADFYDYNDFLDIVDRLLEDMDRVGVYQIATFHPNYCFADTEPNAPENLTNRSPYPILHILREDSLESAIESYPDVDQIPERNINKMESLSKEEKQALFFYL